MYREIAEEPDKSSTARPADHSRYDSDPPPQSMDSFLAARQTGESGHVVGIDMTDARLDKATRLAGDRCIASVDRLLNATRKYGVKSVSLLAIKSYPKERSLPWQGRKSSSISQPASKTPSA